MAQIKMEYIAHIKEVNNKKIPDVPGTTEQEQHYETQSLRSHLEGTARIAESFAVTPWKEVAYNSGLLHDVGKYQSSFQKRIRGASIRVDHSTCGAIEAKREIQPPASLIMEYCIAGHHAGLPDGGRKEDQPGEVYAGHYSLYSRLKLTEFDPYEDYKKEIDLKTINYKELGLYLIKDLRSLERIDKGKALNLFIDEMSYMIRYCYSCLVDADSLDTEHFCSGILRQRLHADYQTCLRRLNSRYEQFAKVKNQTRLQKTRSRIQEQAFQNIHEDADIYLMNMPTGSGKTLCSAKCALMKALETHKQQIIYVIPYNSIITQTAQEFQKIFNENSDDGMPEVHILRHQSTYSIEDDEDADEVYKLQVIQATENWDADFIITTEVQFFESLFSSRRSKLRKLHNMANSVLIFDEAHLMPVGFLQPCLEAVAVLTKQLGSKAIFLTATMPDYRELLDTYVPVGLHVKDLVPDRSEFDAFRKCTFSNLGVISEETLIEKIDCGKSALVVVNSRKNARQLFEHMGGEKRTNLYHLSTLMTKKDLQDAINEIQQKLKKNKDANENPVIVISTSLIEAGVDLDFETAFREMTGLYSILQTGGRCNREGARADGEVCIFEISEENQCRLVDRDPKVIVTRGLFDEYHDISSAECIREYYRRVYLADSFVIEGKSMHSQMEKMGYALNNDSVCSIPFASYDGQMILSRDETLIVPECEEAENLINRIKYGGSSGKVLRALQKYTCSVPQKTMEELLRQGVVENIVGSGNHRDSSHGGVFALKTMDYYSKCMGIMTEGGDYYVD